MVLAPAAAAAVGQARLGSGILDVPLAELASAVDERFGKEAGVAWMCVSCALSFPPTHFCARAADSARVSGVLHSSPYTDVWLLCENRAACPVPCCAPVPCMPESVAERPRCGVGRTGLTGCCSGRSLTLDLDSSRGSWEGAAVAWEL